MKSLRLILIWHVYAATYIAIFLLLAFCAFAAWLPQTLAHQVGFFSEATWQITIILVLLFLSLIINCVLAFFMMPFTERLSCKLKQSSVVDN